MPRVQHGSWPQFKAGTLILKSTLFMPSDNDNHANQMNPNNDAYWESRGYDERPDGWEDEADDGDDDNRANQLNPNNGAYRSSRGV